MIYLTKEALRILSQKLFYVKTADGCNGIMYKQSEETAKRALSEKKDKYLSKCSIYLLVDRVKITKEKDIYWLGLKNKAELEKRFFKVLEKEKLNALYFEAKSKQRIIILSNNDIEKDKYKNVKTNDSEWPCAKAKDDDKTSALLIKKVKNLKRKITDVIKLLSEITIEVAKPKIAAFAKDDTELYKIRREKMKQELEKIIPKYSKDDLALLEASHKEIKDLEEYLPDGTISKLEALLSKAKMFQRIDVTELDKSGINNLNKNLKSFFHDAKLMLDNNDPIVSQLEKISSIIGSELDTSIVNELMENIRKINEEVNKIKG